MNKPAIFILLISMGAFARVITDEKEAKAHFVKLFEDAFKDLVLDDTTGGDWPSSLMRYSYKVAQNGHALDFYFQKADEGFLFEIKKSKKDPLAKQFKVYNTESLEIQSKVFKEFIKRMVTLDKHDLQILNTFEDVKEAINRLGKDKKNIRMMESFKDEHVYWDFFYQNHLVGKFDLTSVKINDSYKLKLRYYVIENQQETMYEVEIDVLTNDAKHFASKMSEMLSKFDIDKYINCIQDAFDHFEKFINSDESGLKDVKAKLEMLPGKSSEFKKAFRLFSPDESFEGFIEYLPPGPDAKFGSYNIQVETAESKKADFNRMTTVEYAAFLKTLNYSHLFVILFDKIRFIFEDQVKKAYFDKTTSLSFRYDFKKASMFANDHGEDQVKLNSADLMKMKYKEESGVIVLSTTSGFESARETSYKFKRSAYKPDYVGRYFNNAIQIVKDSSSIQNNSRKSQRFA